MKIFLSAVSAQFKAARDAVASDLRAIGHEVKAQENFSRGRAPSSSAWKSTSPTAIA